MRIYFITDLPSALRLGGAYVGILNSNYQFVDIDLNSEIYCEIIPFKNGDTFLPINFIINGDFFENPPKNIEIYDYCNCKKIYIREFFSAEQTKIIFQDRFEENLVTLYKDIGVKLVIENKNGSLFENLPYNFNLTNAYIKKLDDNNFFIMEGATKTNFLFIINLDSLKLEFKNSYKTYIFEDELKVDFEFNDYLMHIGSSVWGYDSGFKIKSYAVKPQKQGFPSELTTKVFFEEILCGGNAELYLSKELQAKKDNLRSFLGNFVDVVYPLFNIDSSYMGLVYLEKENIYCVKYFKTESENGEIINILPLE